MKALLTQLFQFPLHLILLGLYSVLNLAAVNRPEILLTEIFRVLLIITILNVILTIIIRLCSKNYHKQLLFYLIVGFFFFSYGHIYEIARGFSLGSLIIGRHRYLLIIALLLIFLLNIYIQQEVSDGVKETRFFNTLGLVMISFPLLTLIRFEFVINRREITSTPEINIQLDSPEDNYLPDIYYIILDSYAREDVLSEIYNFDNHAFGESLESFGFYVATHSAANYPSTAFSLASSLNFDYIQHLDIALPPGSYPSSLIEPIRENRLSRLLNGLGYQVIATASGTLPTSMPDADIFLTPETNLSDAKFQQAAYSINPFEEMYLRTTLLRAPLDLILQRQTSIAAEWIEDRTGAERHRKLVLSAFDSLNHIEEIAGPKFVFVHIISPHRPYLFSSSGEELTQTEAFTLEDTSRAEDNPEEFYQYRDQLLFINQKILESIEHILINSIQQPVIILQSDTGPAFNINWSNPDERNLRTKFPILNAFLLPEECKSELYSTITPVNSFRVVLNCLFKADLPLLEDQSFFVNHHSSDDYEFMRIETILKSRSED